jgi:hypothetical protein
LEHLHWGESIPPDYDLRYLSQSSRLVHFNTIEAAPVQFGGKIVLAAETLEEIQKTWRENKVWVPTDMDDQERFHKRRLENYSWRVMTRLLDQNNHKHQQNKMPHLGRRFSSSHAIHEAVASCATSAKPRADRTPFPRITAKDLHTGSQNNLLKIRRVYSSPRLDADLIASEELHGAERHMKPRLTRTVPGAIDDNDHDLGSVVRFAGLDDMYRQKQQQMPVHNKVESFERKIGKVGKAGICLEYSDHGTGDFRSPSFMVVDNNNGSAISPLRYRKHKIYKGKLPMPDYMPSIRCLRESEASTLVITMGDAISGLEVDLIFGELRVHFIRCLMLFADHCCAGKCACTIMTASPVAQCFATSKDATPVPM